MDRNVRETMKTVRGNDTVG